jgi:hypothetical protein
MKEWNVKISTMVEPDKFFHYIDPADDRPYMVVHPLTYSYLAYSDNIWKAHELNMLWINNHIDAMAAEASQRIDDMVDRMNRQHEPRMIHFMGPMEIVEEESEDGTYTFTFNVMPDFDGSQFAESVGKAAGKLSHLVDSMKYASVATQPLMEDFGHELQAETSYSQLEEFLGRKPNFDEIVRGY